MLPFSLRAHKLKQIEFRNVFTDSQVAPLNRQYRLQVDWESNGEQHSFCTSCVANFSSIPFFEVTQSLEADFDKIDSRHITLRIHLLSENEEKESHCDFKVDLNDLEWLSKDLSKIKPYGTPLVVFGL